MTGLSGALVAHGFDTSVPLLPGHGTSPEDLAGCRWEDWLAAAEAAYVDLARRCGPVLVCGLSMGGALAAAVVAVHPEVVGLVVVNPLIDPPAPAFRALLGELLASGHHFLPGIGGDITDPHTTEDAYDRMPVAALRSMCEGLDELALRVADVACPVLLFTSRNDHVVPTVSSDILAQAVSGPVERVWLERSGHVATLDVERAEIECRVVGFARQRAAPSSRSVPWAEKG